MRKNYVPGWTRTLRVPLIVVIVLFFSLVGAIGAAADSGSATYQYLVGQGFLAGTNPPIGPLSPDVAMAADGSTVTVIGQGTLSVQPKSVSGSGTFTVMDSAGNVTSSGSWTATRLLTFVSYGGAGPQGLPAQNTGGMALIQVQLSTGQTAVLTIFCVLGTPPPSAVEGVHLAIAGGPNFNKQVSGDTDFILQ